MKPYENQMPAGVDSFVEEASKEEVKAPEKPITPKSNDYNQYLNKTAKNLNLSRKDLDKQIDINKTAQRYEKSLGKDKALDFAKNQYKNKIIEESLQKLSPETEVNKQPKQSPEQKLMGVKSVRDAVIDDTLKDTKVNKDIVKKAADAEFNQEQTEQKPNIVTYGNSSKFLEKYGLDKYFEFDGMDLVDKRDYSTTAINFGRDGKSEEELLNEIKKYYPNLSKKEQPEVDEDMERAYGPMYDEETGELNPAYRRREEDISDEELKEELVDNKYYYENARSEEEIAKWLAERQDIPYDRALAFVKANYKGGEIWSEGKTYEPFDKYEDDIRAKAKEVSDSMKSIGYYNLDDKDELEQAYQDLAYDLKEEFPMVDPKEIEKYVAEEGINLY